MIVIATLLADIDAEMIRMAVIILFLVLGGLGQLISKAKQAKPQGPVKPLPPLGPEVPQPPAPPRKAGQTVAQEIDDFLRRAAERNQNRGDRPSPQAEQPRPAPAKARVKRPVAAQVAEPRQVKPVGGQVGDHVRAALDEDPFNRETRHLGAEIPQTVNQIDQHLHQTFDHAVGKLPAVPGEAAVAATVADAESGTVGVDAMLQSGLFVTLNNPESIRQAIVLSEIFRRPEERWE